MGFSLGSDVLPPEHSPSYPLPVTTGATVVVDVGVEEPSHSVDWIESRESLPNEFWREEGKLRPAEDPCDVEGEVSVIPSFEGARVFGSHPLIDEGNCC